MWKLLFCFVCPTCFLFSVSEQISHLPRQAFELLGSVSRSGRCLVFHGSASSSSHPVNICSLSKMGEAWAWTLEMPHGSSAGYYGQTTGRWDSPYLMSALGTLLDPAAVFGWCQARGPGSDLLRVYSVLQQREGYNQPRSKELGAGRLCH